MLHHRGDTRTPGGKIHQAKKGLVLRHAELFVCVRMKTEQLSQSVLIHILTSVITDLLVQIGV